MSLRSALKTFWHDPVWAAVIATAIAASAAALGAMLLPPTKAYLAVLSTRSIWTLVVVSIALPAVVSFYAYRFLQSLRFRAELRVESPPDFAHVPLVRIELTNPGFRRMILSSINFETKEHWDIPDPRRMGVTAPVVNFFPQGTVFIKISDTKGAVASLAADVTIVARAATTVSFRLTTDHGPNFGIGLFPFLIGVELVLNMGTRRLPLPDILVSLHRDTTLSMSTYSTPTPFMSNPGDIQHLANAALSQVLGGAVCSAEVRAALESAVRVNAPAAPG